MQKKLPITVDDKKMIQFNVLPVLTVLFIAVLKNADGHGMILDPPGRSSMWRAGFPTPINYNDNALFCGGFSVQYNEINQGRCGECGDTWSDPRPRANDEGGLYGTGIIGRTYQRGSVINATVQLTASHYGHFEFRLCPKSSAQELVTQECLNRNLLTLADGSTQFPIPTLESMKYYPQIQLPATLTCNNCVLQWRYIVGNSWGDCGNGTSAIGCGNQENFINCSDIAII